MNLHGNAFHTDAGECFRWVYKPGIGHPMKCPGAVVTRGWWQDSAGYWWAVNACAEHASHVSPARPRPGAKFGHAKPPFPAQRKPRIADSKARTKEDELAA